MTQERLNDFAIIALESRKLEKIDYEHIIKKSFQKIPKERSYSSKDYGT
jgi:hypothetical protein